MSELVFVHNTFAWRGAGHAIVGDSLFAGRGSVRGVAYAVPDASGAPGAALGIRAGGDSWVPGELYWCDAAVIAALDAAHGPDFPRRRWQVRAGSDGPRVDAWVWPWSGDWTGAWKGRAVLLGCLLPATAERPTAWYFGYASNMFHFGERRELTVHDTRLARLDGWQVAFGTDSQDDQFCYVTVLPKRNGTVRGAIYRMPNSEMEASLDPQ